MSGLFLGKTEEQGGGGSGPALRRGLPFFIAALSPTGQTRQGQRRQRLPFPPPPSLRRQSPGAAALTTPLPRPPTPFLYPDSPAPPAGASPVGLAQSIAPPTPEPGPASPGTCVRRPLVVKGAHGPVAEAGAAGPGAGSGGGGPAESQCYGRSISFFLMYFFF